MISGFISLLSPLNAQDICRIVWEWSYSWSSWGINNLVSEAKLKKVGPVYGSLKTTTFTSTSLSVVTRVARGGDSSLPEVLASSCVHLSHWQKLECQRPWEQFLRNREKKKEKWLIKSWRSLRLMGQGPGVKARRGEDWRGELITGSRLQRSGFHGSFSALDSSLTGLSWKITEVLLRNSRPP